jgi:hypothetical protein
MPVKLNSSGGGSVTVDVPSTASTYTATLPAATGTVVVSTAVSASTTNTVTNKIAINIGGTTYYILASTSGT